MEQECIWPQRLLTTGQEEEESILKINRNFQPSSCTGAERVLYRQIRPAACAAKARFFYLQPLSGAAADLCPC